MFHGCRLGGQDPPAVHADPTVPFRDGTDQQVTLAGISGPPLTFSPALPLPLIKKGVESILRPVDSFCDFAVFVPVEHGDSELCRKADDFIVIRRGKPLGTMSEEPI